MLPSTVWCSAVIGQTVARFARDVPDRVIGELAQDLVIGRTGFLQMFAAEFLEALGKTEKTPRILRRNRRRLTEERQRLIGLAIACQDAGQIALGVGILRLETDRRPQGGFGCFRIAQTGMGHPKADKGIGVFRIKLDAALQGREALLDPAEFGEADAEVVFDVGIIDHARHRLQERQRIVEEAVLQQAEDISFRLDRVFRDGQDADVLVINRDQGIPATPGILQSEMADQELVELRTPSLGQPGKVKFIDFALEDFRCLFAAHRTVCPADFWRGDFPIGRITWR